MDCNSANGDYMPDDGGVTNCDGATDSDSAATAGRVEQAPFPGCDETTGAMGSPSPCRGAWRAVGRAAQDGHNMCVCVCDACDAAALL